MKEIKQEPKKELYIELKEDIKKLVIDYEHEVGGDGSASIFAMGFISGKVDNDNVALSQLQYLMQAYFFAGVRYAKKYDFTYDWVTKEERAKRAEVKAEELKVQQEKQAAKKQPKKIKSVGDYIG